MRLKLLIIVGVLIALAIHGRAQCVYVQEGDVMRAINCGQSEHTPGLRPVEPKATTTQTELPKGEVFGGYSYVRLGETSADLSPIGYFAFARKESANLHGWNGSVAVYVPLVFGGGRLGVVGDFSGAYGRVRGTVTPYSLPGVIPVDASARFHSVLTGPQFKRKCGPGEVFARFLAGAAKQTPTLSQFDEVAFAYGFGGGFDVPITKHLGVRVIQADLIFAGFDRGLTHQEKILKVSAGLTGRW